ncbi:MAG: hypothetical protein A3G34_00110 [Candidatus Lindowbacteria bacterium RIFCSPLOWO2_12_FULL_62_27]|nr:MAG: hypothetical protein A3G34_00110 [Candidatus Lindowbacteria bacterium RIFCSPLOWO2_12_FULL_62_27]OGH56688.1 MAG: hypothetical protein A3I06_07550 [Candidatus Lindowbacteria bacterium RIFCSPLOWO2_02_FULL_62_12]
MTALLFLLAWAAAGYGEMSQIKVAVGEFKTVTAADRIVRIAVAAPDIADYTVISKREVLINGKSIGRTSMKVWTPDDQVTYLVDVIDLKQARLESVIDNPSLVEKIRKVIGHPDVQVTSAGRGVILSGSVGTEAEKQSTEKILRAFLPDPDQDVTNILEVRRKPRQVRMKVRIMEISENAGKSQGIDWGSFRNSADPTVFRDRDLHDQYSLTGAFASGLPPRVALPFKKSRAFSMVDPFMMQINFLIDSGVIRILSEPEIVALSGARSDVLIGGQVPVPLMTSTQISVSWKDYGIKMSLEPNIDIDSQVTAKIYTEVSTLDYTNAVTVSGFSIPALKVTQATSEIQVKPGQTIFLSGLKREINTKSEKGFPGLSGIPVVGNAFGTRNKKTDKVELVISVTPYIVDEVP